MWKELPPTPSSTNARNTSEQCSIWNHEGKPPCKCICNEHHVQEVHYSLSATFISEYQMNMINVEWGGGGCGGGGGSKVSQGYEMSDIVITPPRWAAAEVEMVLDCRIGDEHTHTHTHSTSHTLGCFLPCKHDASSSIIIHTLNLFFFFLKYVKPRHYSTHMSLSCELIHSETTTMGYGKEKKKSITVQTPPLFSVMKEQIHTHTVQLKYWWRGWGNVHVLVLLQNIFTVGRKLVGSCNHNRHFVFCFFFCMWDKRWKRHFFLSQPHFCCILERKSYNIWTLVQLDNRPPRIQALH